MPSNDYRPFGIGDTVKVLRACRLPAVEDVIGIGTITSTYRPKARSKPAVQRKRRKTILDKKRKGEG